MAKKKLQSTASRPSITASHKTLDTTLLPPSNQVVSLPVFPSSNRNLDFTKHYKNGCDVVVYCAQKTLERMVRVSTDSSGRSLSASTILAYYNSGLSVFLPFCSTMASALGRELRLSDIDRQFIDHYITHLQQTNQNLSSQKNRYQASKAVLVAMGQSGWITNDIFPRNPFPKLNQTKRGQTTLSEQEYLSVVRALKTDMRAIIKGIDPLTSNELVICLLAISLRTGINPTPAMELLIDCLQPHPIKADRYMLVSYKRRGNSTHIQSLRRSKDVESIVSALPDVARIIEQVCKRNSELRHASSHPDLLFVYKSQAKVNAGAICHLMNETLCRGIKVFIERHQLTDADGNPLKLNTMRLRKTFENRLFTLSGQDPFMTAKLGGHSLKVSDNHYLEAPETAEKDWRFMGETRVEELLNHSKPGTIHSQDTPVASCRDTLNGEYAPKNGEHCQKFLACFRCRSFVVTSNDLYRIFSLYWLLISLRKEMSSRAWKRVYGYVIKIIDQEISPQFDNELVETQRLRAKVEPHPFWRDPELLEDEA